MFLPFIRELNDLFKSDRHAVWKLLGGGFVGALVGSRAASDANPKSSATEKVVFTIIVAAVAMIVVGAFLLRDITKKRRADGLPVNQMLIWYLCNGKRSMFL